MDVSKSLDIIKVLTDGTNPFTGEIFADDSPLQHPEMVRALHKAIDVLKVEATRERKRRLLPENTGKPWTDEDDTQLISEFDSQNYKSQK